MSECVWYKIWHQWLAGEITLEELDRQTASNQLKFQFTGDRPE